MKKAKKKNFYVRK